MNSRFLQWGAGPICVATAVVLMLAPPGDLRAQAVDASPQVAAPIDLTGTWVSLVNEDWHLRMVTPAQGDYSGVPLNDEGRRVADSWDPAADEAAGEECKAYSAPAILRVPTRLNISWEDDMTLRMDTDAGMQTRSFNFDQSPPDSEATWQGHSVAEWVVTGGQFGVSGGGHLKVVTTNLRPGYLRKNGVPYSADGVMTEYFYNLSEPNGDTLLFVVTMFEDPEYLDDSLAMSQQFKKIPDGSGWNPMPCSAR